MTNKKRYTGHLSFDSPLDMNLSRDRVNVRRRYSGGLSSCWKEVGRLIRAAYDQEVAELPSRYRRSAAPRLPADNAGNAEER